MNRLILTAIATLMLGGSVLAGDGFIKHGEYWWRNGKAYTLRIERHGYQTYKYYTAVPTYDKGYDRDYKRDDYKEPAKVDAKDPGWREKLLEIAEQRDAYQQKLAESAQEHQEYMEALKALGLEGEVGGYQPQYQSSPYGYSYVTQAEQGGTVYGYSYATLADVYGDTDLAALYQQANRLAENAQGLAGDATSGFQALVEQEGSNRAKVAEILAKAQLLKSLEPSTSKVRTETRVYGSKPHPKPHPKPPAGPTAPGAPDLKPGGDLSAVIAKNCIGCHSSATAAGKTDLFPDGVNMELYGEMTVPQKQAVVQSVLSGRMPKDADELSVADSALFFADLQAAILQQGQQAPEGTE